MGSEPVPEQESAVLEVVGTDARGLEGLSLLWRRRLRQVDLVAAPQRLLDPLRCWVNGTPGSTPELIPTDRPDELIARLRPALAEGKQVVVLASGDPLWFGIGRLLLQAFPTGQLRFHPAPTSLQLAFARIGRPWQDASWLSLHGRDP